MVHAITAGAPPAASSATDEAVRETEVLSGLTQLALEMARTVQAQALAALAAGDLDRAGRAEARFSSLFLGVRRAIALEARLRRQRQEAAAAPAADEAAMLSELMELALALAQGFQALGVAALKAGDLDRGGDMETRFSSLFLGIRRAIALKIKLREQREQAQRQAQVAKDRLQAEKDDRRQAVAQGVAQAIAAAPETDTEAQERLTTDLWERLTEDERIDTDLADTALPIEALIASLCRALGLPPRGTPPAGGPAAAAAKAGTAGAKGRASGQTRASSNVRRTIAAEHIGEPEGERRTGEIVNQDREPVPTLPGDDRPPVGTGPPATAPPGDRRQWDDADWAGHCRRETERNARRRPQIPAHIRRHG